MAFAIWYGISRVPRLPLWGGLVAVLLFPYLITTWSPTVTFLATAYYDQQMRVSEHVEENFPEVQAQWKQNISLEKPIPITSIFEFSIQDSRFFQISSWDRVLLDGFGYKNSFFAFIGRGWSFTTIGLVTTLMGLYLGLEKAPLKAFLQDMNRILPGVGLLLGFIFLSLVWVNIVNHQLDTLFAKGEYHQVVATSKTLASWYPPLRGDEAFLKRMAEAGFYGNEPDPALINFTKGIERYRVGDYFKAEDYFQRSLTLQPNLFLVREYLATTFLNEGVEYFNTPNLPYSPHGHNYPNFANTPFNPIAPNNPSAINNRKPSWAAEHFEKALQVFPGHISALYDLMLTTAVNAQFNKSAEIAREIIAVEQYFQQPNNGLLGQAYLHLAWADYHNESNLSQAWKRYRQSIDTRSWKQSVEAGQ
ncbi:MAG: tetratricopeptide repeat protein [Xenococcaceae cyanobacterium]